MIALLSATIAAAVVAGVLLVALLDRRTPMPRGERLGWCMVAGGLVWAGPARFLGQPAGLGDLLFLAGVLVVLLAVHGAAMLKKADALDGRVDGRIGVIPLHRGIAPVVDDAPTGGATWSGRPRSWM